MKQAIDDMTLDELLVSPHFPTVQKIAPLRFKLRYAMFSVYGSTLAPSSCEYRSETMCETCLGGWLHIHRTFTVLERDYHKLPGDLADLYRGPTNNTVSRRRKNRIEEVFDAYGAKLLLTLVSGDIPEELIQQTKSEYSQEIFYHAWSIFNHSLDFCPIRSN